MTVPVQTRNGGEPQNPVHPPEDGHLPVDQVQQEDDVEVVAPVPMVPNVTGSQQIVPQVFQNENNFSQINNNNDSQVAKLGETPAWLEKTFLNLSLEIITEESESSSNVGNLEGADGHEIGVVPSLGDIPIPEEYYLFQDEDEW